MDINDTATSTILNVDDNAAGKYINVNQRYCEITGYSLAELLAMKPADLTHVADRAAEVPFVQAFMRGGVDEYVRQKRMIRKDGQSIWVSVNDRLLRDQNGRPLRTVGVLVDAGRVRSHAQVACPRFLQTHRCCHGGGDDQRSREVPGIRL